MKSSLSSQDLKKALKFLNMGQEDFAECLSVRHATVNRWLNGKVPVPGYVEAWLRDVHPDIYNEVKREG